MEHCESDVILEDLTVFLCDLPAGHDGDHVGHEIARHPDSMEWNVAVEVRWPGHPVVVTGTVV